MLSDETYRYVSPLDLAIDFVKSDPAKFREDPTAVVPRAGMRPMLFTLRPLSSELLDWVKEGTLPESEERRKKAFRAAVVQVENLPDPQNEGSYITLRGTDAVQTSLGRITVFSVRDCDPEVLADCYVEEVGHHALWRSRVPKALRRRSPLPPTLDAVFRAVRGHLAAEHLASADPSSSPVSSPQETAPRTSPSAEPSEPATAATATASATYSPAAE